MGCKAAWFAVHRCRQLPWRFCLSAPENRDAQIGESERRTHSRHLVEARDLTPKAYGSSVSVDGKAPSPTALSRCNFNGCFLLGGLMMRLWDENPASLGAADQEHPRAARRRCGACSPRRTPILVPFGAPGRICNTPLLIDPGCRAPPRAQGGSALAAKLVSNTTPTLHHCSCQSHAQSTF